MVLWVSLLHHIYRPKVWPRVYNRGVGVVLQRVVCRGPVLCGDKLAGLSSELDTGVLYGAVVLLHYYSSETEGMIDLISL